MNNKNKRVKFTFDQVKNKSFPYDMKDEIRFKPDGLVNMLLWDSSKVFNVVAALSLYFWIQWIPSFFTQSIVGYVIFGLMIACILYGFYCFVQAH